MIEPYASVIQRHLPRLRNLGFRPVADDDVGMSLSDGRYRLIIGREQYLSNLDVWLIDPSGFRYGVAWIIDAIAPGVFTPIRRRLGAASEALNDPVTGCDGHSAEGLRRWSEFIETALDSDITLMETYHREVLAWPNAYREAYEEVVRKLEF